MDIKICYSPKYLYNSDKRRNSPSNIKRFLFFFRHAKSKNLFIKVISILYTKLFCLIHHLEISYNTQIGGGLYIGHPYCITINPKAILGWNINIHKGSTIGQENRGKRKGVPKIGNDVYIGINSTIVGNICVGDDVLIAPNTFVNCDIPNHSIVIGNPCKIIHKENATLGYINSRASM